MSWLDQFFVAYATVQFAGVAAPQERTLNFINATGVDDPANGRTNITVSGSIGGGAASSSQGGAIALPAGSSVIAVDLTSVDATVNLDQVSYVAGLAYQFDTRGSHNIIFTSALGILAPQNGGVSQTSVTVNPVSESVIAKANAWGSWSLI